MSYEIISPPKPFRRKNLQVPIHNERDFQKTFNINNDVPTTKYKQQKYEDNKNETSPQKNKKFLNKENKRLLKENEEIFSKFNELEELSVKKITKLKEKVQNFQKINEEIKDENLLLKKQSQELLSNYDNLRRQFELNKHCQQCDDYKIILKKINDENNHLKIMKQEVDEDINMLKNVVYRLNLQLERYQEILRKNNIKIKPLNPQQASNENVSIIGDLDLLESHNDHTHTPISWGKVNSHTLGPLLDAYQDTIAEKDEIIQNYQTELSNFTGQLKEVIAENETLHKQLTEDENCSAKLHINLIQLKKELKTTKEQNDELIKKCALKQDKIEEILKCYEEKIDQFKCDYNVLHEQYCVCKNEIALLKEKNKVLVESQDEFKNERHNYIPISVHSASVNECKKWYEELKHQYENEKIKLKETINGQNKLINELNQNIIGINKEKEEFDNKIKSMEKLLKKGETKILELEHNLNEVQLSRNACRKQLHKAMNFAKDLVAEQESLLNALNQKQYENKVVKKIGCDIASRMDNLKSQLKDVQKEAWQELNTVEQRIQEQNGIIETMKQEHNNEIERLKIIIKEQEENLLLKDQKVLPNSQYLIYKNKHNF